MLALQKYKQNKINYINSIQKKDDFNNNVNDINNNTNNCDNKYTYKIAIGTMFRNEAYFLKEWIDYHLMIGVEHFYMYNDSSTDNWKEILNPYINKGLVEVFEDSSIGSWPSSQVFAFQKIVTNFGNQTEWMALIDIDEFIFPMKNKTLSECLNKYFSKADAIYMSWYHYGTSYINIKPYETILDKLITSSEKNHSCNATGKSIFKPLSLKDFNFLWCQHFVLLKQKCAYFYGDGTNPIPFDENKSDILLDGTHRGDFLRVNHYAHRDEKYFFNVRYVRDGNKNLSIEHYNSFNKVKNMEMVDYLKKYH